MKSSDLQLRRQGMVMRPDEKRVLLKPFVPSPGGAARTKRIVEQIMNLSEAEARRVLEGVLEEFRDRHRDVEGFFERRYNHLKLTLPQKIRPTRTKSLLIGSYFSCEYSLEAAALFNPSIVPHFDQSGVEPGSIRFIMSLRATGEGHISSIEFRTGMINHLGEVRLDHPNRYVSTPKERPDPVLNKADFTMMLHEQGALTSVTRDILRPLSGKFRRSQLMTRIARFRKSHGKLTRVQDRSIEQAAGWVDPNYSISFPDTQEISERAIFPVSSYETNGIEDARFVRFSDDDGTFTYYSTYTAYNGREIRPQLIQTTDFARFKVRSLTGGAAKNKGMALFPRKIGGKFAMITRQDAESLYVAWSDDVSHWTNPIRLRMPTYTWEFTQIGNCGSPLETDKGWLLLTHGVGPVRKYCIGAILLDRDDPAKVIGQLTHPLIAPNETEREGYVPNVVYTCGAILHNGRLVIPYAMSDTATRFADIGIDELFGRMQ